MNKPEPEMNNPTAGAPAPEPMFPNLTEWPAPQVAFFDQKKQKMAHAIAVDPATGPDITGMLITEDRRRSPLRAILETAKPPERMFPLKFAEGGYVEGKLPIRFDEFNQQTMKRIERAMGVPKEIAFEDIDNLAAMAAEGAKQFARAWEKAAEKLLCAVAEMIDDAQFHIACRAYRRHAGRLPGSNRTKRLRKKRRTRVMAWWRKHELLIAILNQP